MCVEFEVHAEVGGRAATADELMAAAAATRRPTFVCLFDVSESMKDHLPLLRACADELLAAATSLTAVVGVCLFASDAHVVLPPTHIVDAASGAAAGATLAAALRSTKGLTDLHAGLTAAMDMAAATAHDDVQVLVLTDGAANQGMVDDADIVAAAAAHPAFAACRFHFVGFAAEDDALNDGVMCRLSLATEGTYSRVRCARDVGTAFGDCVAQYITTAATRLLPRTDDVEWASEWGRGLTLRLGEPRVMVARTPLPSRLEFTYCNGDGGGATLPVCVSAATTLVDDALVAAHMMRVRVVDALRAYEEALAEAEVGIGLGRFAPPPPPPMRGVPLLRLDVMPQRPFDPPEVVLALAARARVSDADDADDAEKDRWQAQMDFEAAVAPPMNLEAAVAPPCRTGTGTPVLPTVATTLQVLKELAAEAAAHAWSGDSTAARIYADLGCNLKAIIDASAARTAAAAASRLVYRAVSQRASVEDDTLSPMASLSTLSAATRVRTGVAVWTRTQTQL